jgi:membrane protein required for colicin V production
VIDFVIGAGLVALLVRGWRRGLVRELLDLVGLVVGAWVAFRLSGPVGDWVTDRFGVTSEWARLGAGVLLFAAVGVGLGLVARALSRVMDLPGLNLANRLGGAGFALAWGLLILTVLVAVAAVLPLGGLGRALSESRIVAAVAGPGSLPSRMLERVAGRPIAGIIAALEDLVGGRRVLVDGDERVELEPVAAVDYARDQGSAEEMLRFINELRLEEGVDPLPWSNELAAVAAAHAEEMYREGYLSPVSPLTGRVADRVAAAGVRLAAISENIGLAATTRAIHEEMTESAPHRARMIARAVDRVGVAAVAGPYGVIVVEVFGG